MATIQDRFQVLFSAETGPLERAVSKVGDTMKRLGQVTQRVGKALLGAAAAGATAFAAAAAVAAQRVDRLAKSADRLQISVTTMQNLTEAAELSGASLESVLVGVEKLQRQIGQARLDPKGQAAGTLGALGFTGKKFEALAGQSPDQAFATVLKRLGDLSTITAGLDRLAAGAPTFVKLLKQNRLFTTAGQADLGQSLFGESFGQLLPFAQNIDQTLSGVAARRDRLGTGLSRAEAANIERSNDAIAKIGTTISDLVAKIIGNDEVVLVIERFQEAFDDLIVAMGGAEGVARGLARAFNATVDAGSAALGFFGGVRSTSSIDAAYLRSAAGIRQLQDNGFSPAAIAKAVREGTIAGIRDVGLGRAN